MANKPNMSIIIPVYNVEKYIGATLESVLRQKNISLEVLVVNDSSTDSTAKIVEQYTKKYPFIKLLNNTRQKCGAGARNSVIPHIKGETCFFLDGDDLLFPNSLYKLYNLMKSTNAPIVRGELSHFCHQRWLFYMGAKYFGATDNNYPTGSFVQFLYNSQFLKDNNLLFPEDITVADDRSFFCHAFSLVDDIPTIDTPIYIYRMNHKKTFLASVINATSFVKHFHYIELYLTNGSKQSYLPSYIQAQFSYDCLRNTYYALQKSEEDAYTYLEECAKVIADKKDMLEESLAKFLKEQSSNFWQACIKHDTKLMLQALQNTDILQPYTSYIGVKEKQINIFWPLTRILHRVKNSIVYFKDFKSLMYVILLDTKTNLLK